MLSHINCSSYKVCRVSVFESASALRVIAQLSVTHKFSGLFIVFVYRIAGEDLLAQPMKCKPNCYQTSVTHSFLAVKLSTHQIKIYRSCLSKL